MNRSTLDAGSTDLLVTALMLGPLLGWTHCVVAAGLLAAASSAQRLRDGRFMRPPQPEASPSTR